jgi:alpha-glucosidase
MKKLITILFLSILFFMNQTEAKFIYLGDVVSYKKYNDRVEFQLTNAKFNLYVIDNNVVRFRYNNRDEFSPAPSYSVIYESKKNIPFTFEDKGKFFQLSTDDLIVKITKTPCRASIFDKDLNLLNEDEHDFGVSFDGHEVRCFKTLFDDERFFGLGEKSDQLSKRGNQYTMWNTDFPQYTKRTDPLYVSIPFFIGERKYPGDSQNKCYGIFFDNTYKSYFNMGASNNRFYWFGAEGGEMDYYFIYGPGMKRVISSYTMLTGRIQLPPEWALGYQQSKWSYYPESTVRRIARTFRDKKIPCDVIYLDIDYMDGYRVFTWNKNRFPNPDKMLADLKSEGFKIVPIIDPGVKVDTTYFAAKEGVKKNLFVKYPDGKFYEGEVWPSWAYFPDFTKQETRDWWAKKLSVLLNEGVEGFWNDMNEPSVWGQAFPDIIQFNDNGYSANHKKIHNVYALDMVKAGMECVEKYSPDKRHFLLTRSGFAGTQRYSAVWTGDNSSTNEDLKLACIMPQNMGISGLSFVGSDVGGFVGDPTPNLYIRWMELGSFTPFFRGHSAINQPDKEPWAFGNEVESDVREMIDLRYKLLPFLYNEFYNSTQTGLPIMRSMFLNNQNDDECYKAKSQYQFMIGENLLVAPVLNDYDTFKELYLPEGKWIDWRTNKIYDGKKWIIVNAPINQIPLFIKEGGIIPMQEVQQFVGEKKIDELELVIYPSDQSEYSIYEDDGISFDYKKGKYSITNVTSSKQNDKIEIRISQTKNDFDLHRKDYLLKILDVSAIKQLVLNGIASINKFENSDSLKKSDQGYFFDEAQKILFVKVKFQHEIIISF